MSKVSRWVPCSFFVCGELFFLCHHICVLLLCYNAIVQQDTEEATLNRKTAVKCIESGEEFGSIAEAARVRGCSAANISKAIRKGWRRRGRSLALHDRHEQGKGHKGARDRVQHLLRVRADGRRQQGGLVRHVPGEAHRPLGALLTGRPSSSAIMSAPRLSKGKGFVCGRIRFALGLVAALALTPMVALSGCAASDDVHGQTLYSVSAWGRDEL